MGGGLHGACVAKGVCMAERGSMCGRGGHAWQEACMAGGVHGRGHVWHACPPRQILRVRHTVNEWAVCILLECILARPCKDLIFTKLDGSESIFTSRSFFYLCLLDDHYYLVSPQF